MSARVRAAMLAGCGALLVVVPRWLLPVCPAEAEMRCAYTLLVATIAGAVVIIAAAVSLASPRVVVRWSLVTSLAAGIIAAVAPWTFAPVCGSPRMPCVSGAAPGLLVAGLLTAGVAAAALATHGRGSGEVRT